MGEVASLCLPIGMGHMLLSSVESAHIPPIQEHVFKRKILFFQECYHSSRGQSPYGFGVVGKNLFPSNRLLLLSVFFRVMISLWYNTKNTMCIYYFKDNHQPCSS